MHNAHIHRHCSVCNTFVVTLGKFGRNDAGVACRGTVGVGEIMEALSDPVKAKNFAGRIKKLITDAKGNERVRPFKITQHAVLSQCYGCAKKCFCRNVT